MHVPYRLLQENIMVLIHLLFRLLTSIYVPNDVKLCIRCMALYYYLWISHKTSLPQRAVKLRMIDVNLIKQNTIKINLSKAN